MSILNDIRRLSRYRSEQIDELTKQLYQIISNGSNDLYLDIIQKYLVKELSVTENGVIKNISANYSSTFNLDKLYKDGWINSTGSKLIDFIDEGTTNINRVNIRYFELFDKDLVKQIAENIEKKILKNYGLDLEGKTSPQSILKNIISGDEPLNRIKGLIQSSIASEVKLIDLQATLKTSLVDEKLLTRYLDNSLVTNTFDRYDRQTSKEYSDALALDYGIYQGGLIQDSRDFCIIRNGQVFSKAEIALFGTAQDKFGGYTNKSTGEFQGKWRKGLKVYDPFVDLGCYNCGHFFTWITYDMAILLRPELKKAA